MKNINENKEKAIQYLYGELTESEREDFEEHLFEDEDLGLFLENVENDLIDEYIRGELEFDEKRKFEKHFLTSESRAARVDMARKLNEKVFDDEKLVVVSTEKNTDLFGRIADLFGFSNPMLAGSLAILLLAVLLGGFWIINQNRGSENIASENSNQQENIPVNQDLSEPEKTPERENKPLEELETNSNLSQPNTNQTIVNEDETRNVNAKPDPSPKPSPETPAATPKPVKEQSQPKKEPKILAKQPTVFAFTLSPPLRSSSTPVLNIPGAVKTVSLNLVDNFGQKYEKFSIDLNTQSGTTVWSSQVKALKNRIRNSITVSIPGDKFRAGNYEIAVRGITKEGSVEEISFYNFLVRRK